MCLQLRLLLNGGVDEIENDRDQVPWRSRRIFDSIGEAAGRQRIGLIRHSAGRKPATTFKLKKRELTVLVVLDDGDLVSPQIGDRVTSTIDRNDVEIDERRSGPERGRDLSRLLSASSD